MNSGSDTLWYISLEASNNGYIKYLSDLMGRYNPRTCPDSDRFGCIMTTVDLKEHLLLRESQEVELEWCHSPMKLFWGSLLTFTTSAQTPHTTLFCRDFCVNETTQNLQLLKAGQERTQFKSPRVCGGFPIPLDTYQGMTTTSYYS